jgi:heptosyltransferase-2
MPQPWSSIESAKPNCRHFRGDIPCVPHKETGAHCIDEDGATCPHYEAVNTNILIIKLGAIGDVIRTTPLLRRLSENHPEARIWWLTNFPDVLPPQVDVVLPFSSQSLAILAAVRFDLLLNLDKDREACALAATLQSLTTKGFTLRHGVPYPADADAESKFMTGLFDDISKENTKSYLEEIFSISGFTFTGERYILDSCASDGYAWKLPRGKKIVGLNTGCGGRWATRLWPDQHWVALARKLKKAGYAPVLLGGEQEHARNRKLARKSGARYPGHFPLRQFINLVDQCDLVVTAVTMAMHITIGLGKKIVLFNNIFNRHEFELYGLGDILEPEADCTCYFAPRCTNPKFSPRSCMKMIRAQTVFESCKRLLAS